MVLALKLALLPISSLSYNNNEIILRRPMCSLTPFSHLALLGENYSQQIYPVTRDKLQDSFSLSFMLFKLKKAFPQHA